MTISDNYCGTATATATAGGLGNAGGSVTMKNTILANNVSDYSPDCANGFISDGFNLVLDDSGCTITGILDTIIGQDPMLAPLVDVGGISWAHPLYRNSPGIDDGPSSCIYVDQRQLGRPKDGNMDGIHTCDIGAYEAYICIFHH